MRNREPRKKPKRAFRAHAKQRSHAQQDAAQPTDEKSQPSSADVIEDSQATLPPAAGEPEPPQADRSSHSSRGNSEDIDPVKPISSRLMENQIYLKQLFRRSSDIVERELRIPGVPDMYLLFVDGLVNSAHIDNSLIKPLVSRLGTIKPFVPPATIEAFVERDLAIGQIVVTDTLTDAIDRMMTGDTLLLVDGYDLAAVISAKKWEHRSPSEPDTEAVVRGPREGFVESLRTNTALLRRRIRTPHFQIESLKIGRVTKTDVVLCYIEGIITESVVNEVRSRLERIDIDGVIDSGYVEEFLEDHPFSPFPTVQETERPDTAAACLLEGRCVILVDGSPFALIAPINLWGALQASEDYYQRFIFGTLIRWLRYVFVIIALTLPSMYIAITTFHQEMLPTNLLLSIAASRESSPFPALVEALVMEITFEALREAGVRLPKTVGQAVSIVGALVIGQAAVSAGIVSAPMVIVVSLTGIANFTIPRYSFGLGIRMLRFPLMFLAGSFGLYGIVIGLLAIIVHVASLRSIGVPYTTPIAPLFLSNLKDTLFRAPWFAMNRRPTLFGYQNPVRVPKGQKPSPQPESDTQPERGGSR